MNYLSVDKFVNKKGGITIELIFTLLSLK